MNILVTGTSGFVGSRLAKLLSEKPNHRLIESEGAAAAFAERSVDYVFHLAESQSGDSVKDCRVNVLETVRLLDLSKRAGVRKFIYLSSGEVYDPKARRPWVELSLINPLTKLDPDTPYGISKKCAEEYVRHTFKRHAILRVSSVYGPGQPTEDSVVATFAHWIRNDQPCHIFGSGEQTQDFIYVDDVVNAAEMCMTKISGTFNVSTGAETSLNHLADMMYRVSRKNKNVIHDPPISGEIPHSCLSNEWLRNAGWQFRWALKDGLKQTMRF